MSSGYNVRYWDAGTICTYVLQVSLQTDYRIDYLATHWYKSTQGAELTINVGLVDGDLS